jgi:hypothetical protein
LCRQVAVTLAAVCAVASCGRAERAEAVACTSRCIDDAQCGPGESCRDDRFCHRATDDELCSCLSLRCGDVSGACGEIADGCGGTISCGDCANPLVCGGAGKPNLCGDPAECVPQPCPAGACGPFIDSCGDAVECPTCPSGQQCRDGRCEICAPDCADGELACGDDGCGGSCGSCPDERWSCHPQGVCCIRNGEKCHPLLEGCNCCPGLFCVSGFCAPAAGCAMAPSRTAPDSRPDVGEAEIRER